MLVVTSPSAVSTFPSSPGQGMAMSVASSQVLNGPASFDAEKITMTSR